MEMPLFGDDFGEQGFFQIFFVACFDLFGEQPYFLLFISCFA